MTTFLRFPFRLTIVAAIVASIGLLDSFYLTLQHYIGFPTVCLVANGCAIVLTSSYAILFGVSAALLGVLYYSALLLLLLRALETRRIIFLLLFGCMSVFGFLVSAWFVYLQLVVLSAICSYCMISAASSLLLFVFSVWLIINYRFTYYE